MSDMMKAASFQRRLIKTMRICQNVRKCEFRKEPLGEQWYRYTACRSYIDDSSGRLYLESIGAMSLHRKTTRVQGVSSAGDIELNRVHVHIWWHFKK